MSRESSSRDNTFEFEVADKQIKLSLSLSPSRVVPGIHDNLSVAGQVANGSS